MALTNNTLPSVIPQFTLPLDANMAFALPSAPQTLTATGFVNSANAVLSLQPGRFTGMLALDITALDVTSGNETYQFSLIGSNDASVGNGNADLLAFHDFAAASSGRIIATQLAASPAIPDAGRAGSLIAIPFTNIMQGFIYQYLKLNVTAGGTTPSVTLSAWVTPIEMKV